MTRPSPEQLLAETARLAHHFHWPLDTILDLEHADRRGFLAEADAMAAPGSLPAQMDTQSSDESGAALAELLDDGFLLEES